MKPIERIGVAVGLVLGLTALGPGAAWGDVLILTNGDRISGTILKQTDEATVIEHPVLGALTVPADQISSVFVGAAPQVEPAPEPETEAAPEPGPETAAAEVAAPTPPAPEEPEPEDNAGMFGTSFLRGWNKGVELGFSGKSGNTEETDIFAAVFADFEDERDRWEFDARYFLSTSEGETTDNEFYASILKDWKYPNSPWFWFARARYDWDQFEDWRHRISAHMGPGYEIINTEELKWRARAGVGVLGEFGGEADDRVTPEGLAGTEVIWNISERQKLTAHATVFPDLGDVGRYRSLSGAEWSIKIDRADGLSLKFGIEHEYQSETDDDSDHNDFRYYGALVFDF